MFKSRIILACITLAAATAVHAQTPPPGGAPNPAQFAQHKQKELARIAARLQNMQTLQSCVQAANDHAAIHACNHTARQAAKSQQ